MPRNFPSWIYQNSTSAQSKGRFLVHTISPRFVAQVTTKGFHIDVDILELIDECDESLLNKFKAKAVQWYIANVQMPEQEMKGMELELAYVKLISERGISNTLNLHRSTVNGIKKNLEQHNKFPSCELMRSHLELAGWEKIGEELWWKNK